MITKKTMKMFSHMHRSIYLVFKSGLPLLHKQAKNIIITIFTTDCTSVIIPPLANNSTSPLHSALEEIYESLSHPQVSTLDCLYFQMCG